MMRFKLILDEPSFGEKRFRVAKVVQKHKHLLVLERYPDRTLLYFGRIPRNVVPLHYRAIKDLYELLQF